MINSLRHDIRGWWEGVRARLKAKQERAWVPCLPFSQWDVAHPGNSEGEDCARQEQGGGTWAVKTMHRLLS